MNYKQRIILSKQNTNHLIMENEIVPVVHSGGGYTVEFFLKYTNSDRKLVEIETGRMLLGNKKTYDLPAGASDYEVSCCAWNGSKWKDAFYTEKSETPFNCTFRTYGALPNPKMEKIED